MNDTNQRTTPINVNDTNQNHMNDTSSSFLTPAFPHPFYCRPAGWVCVSSQLWGGLTLQTAPPQPQPSTVRETSRLYSRVGQIYINTGLHIYTLMHARTHTYRHTPFMTANWIFPPICINIISKHKGCKTSFTNRVALIMSVPLFLSIK
jgi:hypothetical protein